MAGSVNKVILIGNLGADPEIKSFQNGGKIANIRIATSEQWKDRMSGERKERTEWHSVAIFNENLGRIAEHSVGQVQHARKLACDHGLDRRRPPIGGDGGGIIHRHPVRSQLC